MAVDRCWSLCLAGIGVGRALLLPTLAVGSSRCVTPGVVVNVEFVASFSPIVEDIASARRFYGEELGIDFDGGEEDYAFTEQLDGVKHLGLWPLSQAADACFGTPSWPADLPRPQASIEFEVASVAAAAEELVEGGHQLLHGPRTEPWGQTVARLLSDDGLIVAVCHTPHLREGRHLTDNS
jgi:catechol 2,3-dioxygenase-like lactoylglutathione lyase family enzyme